MALRINCYDRVLVGKRVYLPFKPQNPGKVIEDRGGNGRNRTLVVQFLKGPPVEHLAIHLVDFDGLIEDHRNKLRTHEENLKRLEELCPTKTTQSTGRRAPRSSETTTS